MPCGSAPSRGHCHLLAVGIGAGDTAIVGAITFPDTGDEKAHWLLRTAGTATLPAAAGGRAAAASLPATGPAALCERDRHRERRQRERCKSLSRLTHRAFSFRICLKRFLESFALPGQRVAQGCLLLLLELLGDSIDRSGRRGCPAFCPDESAHFLRACLEPLIVQHPFEFACHTGRPVAVLPQRPCDAKSCHASGIVRLIVCMRHHEHRPPRP